MKITTTLSVSSVILASVLSGCSQQQVVGGSQVSGGSQQQTENAQVSNVTGGSQQVAGGSQVSGGSQQSSNGSQVATSGSSQQMTSQQQVEQAVPVVSEPIVTQPIVTQPRVYKPRKMQQRVYTRGPAPRVTRTVAKRGLGLPPAKPGQCFAKAKVPATYKTLSKRVLIQKASSKRVLVRAPQYQWVNKKVLVRKASYRTRTQPAQYRTVNQRVMVKPAYDTWKKGHGAITRIDNSTGEIMCRVKVPAVYKNVQKRVLVRPAKTIRTLVPAVYKNTRSLKATAPALYKTVKRPARYKTQSYRVKVGGARYVWKPVLCQTNAPKAYKATAKHRPVARTTYKKQYRNNGISRHDYLRVMNAGKVKKKAVRTKTKASIISQSDYQRVMSAGKKRSAPKAKAGISQADYQRVMNAGKTKTSNAKKVEKRAVLKPKSATATPAAATKATTADSGKDAATNKTSIVLGIQKALKAKGFDPGATDGKMGAGTAAALKAFQSSRGLPVGVLTKDTFRALGLIR